MKQTVTVLGIGNILLSDEGIGVDLVKSLADKFQIPDNVELVDGGTSGIDLLPYVKKEDVLIIIDALATRVAPGTMTRLEDDEVPAFLAAKFSPHQIALPDLLATAQLMENYPKKVVLIGIEPEKLDVGVGLSETLSAKRNEYLQTARLEIERALGHPILDRS